MEKIIKPIKVLQSGIANSLINTPLLRVMALLLFLCFELVLLQKVQGQASCSSAQNLGYSNQFPDYQLFQFIDDSLWFSFQADSTGLAFFSLISKVDSGGALLQSITVLSGACDSLQIVYHKTYTSNDSLCISYCDLQYGKIYKLILTRSILNACDTCNREILLCLTNFNSLIPLGTIFHSCNTCFYDAALTNGDFSQGNSSFTSGYTYGPTSTSSVGRYAVSNTVAALTPSSSPIFWYQATGYPPTAPANKFLMCDLRSDGNSPPIWERTIYWLELGRRYQVTFHAINLSKASFGPDQVPPRIEFLVNDVAIPAHNVEVPNLPGPHYTVDIDKDEQWHRLCYEWVSQTTYAKLTIRQLFYLAGPHSFPESGHDAGIDNILLRIESEPPEINIKDTCICQGSSIDLGSLIEIIGGQAPFVYTWSNLSSPSSNPGNIVIPSSQSSYFLTLTDAYGCSTTVEVEVCVEEHVPNFSITGDNNNCAISSTYTCTIDEPSYNYSWSVLCPTGSSWGSISGQASGLGLSSITINWDHSNFPALPLSVTIRLSIFNECDTNSFDFTVFQCCHEPSILHIYNNQTISYDLELSAKDIEINGTMNITGEVVIKNNSRVFMGALAKIIIHPGASLSVEGDVTFQMLCHNYMWDGIYAISPESFVSFNSNTSGNPILKDAVNGIVSVNGGKIHIINTEFNINDHSIQLVDYGPGNSLYVGPIEAIVHGCSFNCLNVGTSPPYDKMLLSPPCVNKYPDCAILANQVCGTVIGDLSGASNTFENLYRGIYSVNAEIQVENALFSNMLPANPADLTWPFQHASILAITNDGKNLMEADPYLIVDGGLNTLNSFTNCPVGISVQSVKTTVQHCLFTDCIYPVHLLNPAFPNQITDNVIQKGPLNAQYDIRGTGISIIAANTSVDESPLKLMIKGNIISGMKNGIHCFNQNNVSHFPPKENSIIDNTIHLLAPLNSQYDDTRQGILLENCDGINVIGNTVEFTGNTISIDLINRGLKIARSPGSQVSYNHFTEVDAGIFTAGELQNTLFSCNVFEDCYNGFFFGPFTAMTDQIMLFNNEYYCTNNAWVGNYPQGQSNQNQYRMTQNLERTNLANAFKYYFDPLAGQAHQPDDDLISNFSLHPCVTFINTPVRNDPASICPIIEAAGDSCPGSMDTTTRAYLFQSILEEAILYDTLISQNRFYEKDYLFSFLARFPEAIELGGEDDASYQQFVDNLYNTDIDFIRQVYEFMHDKRLDSASFYNDMVSNANTWLDNRRLVNEIYLKTWAVDSFGINQADSLVLAGIALQSPYEGGDGVYTARCLLNLFDVELHGVPYCMPVSSDKLPSLLIWPNPASTLLNLEIPEPSGSGMHLEFINSSGQLISRFAIPVKKSKITLPIDHLPTGFYQARLVQSLAVIATAKLCVIRK